MLNNTKDFDKIKMELIDDLKSRGVFKLSVLIITFIISTIIANVCFIALKDFSFNNIPHSIIVIALSIIFSHCTMFICIAFTEKRYCLYLLFRIRTFLKIKTQEIETEEKSILVTSQDKKHYKIKIEKKDFDDYYYASLFNEASQRWENLCCTCHSIEKCKELVIEKITNQRNFKEEYEIDI